MPDVRRPQGRREPDAVHALLIEGTMRTLSKAAICTLALAAAAKVVVDRRSWAFLTRQRAQVGARRSLINRLVDRAGLTVDVAFLPRNPAGTVWSRSCI